MKKQFAKLSKSEREKAERDYHQMSPDEFNHLMRRATKNARPVTKQTRKKAAEKKRAA